MANKNWTVSDLTGAKCLGTLSVENGEKYGTDFEVLSLDDRLVFGSFCNTGFLESGFILKEEGETQTEVLNELLADLEVYYRDGAQYVSRIVCNERM